jgi:hypothetical protein
MAASDQTGTSDTTATIGTKGLPGAAPSPVTEPDTSGVALGTAAGWTPTATTLSGTKDTLTGTVVDKYQAPHAQPVPSAASNADTTKTDSPVGNGITQPINPIVWQSGTTDTAAFGAVAAGTLTVPAAPVAPTAVAGDRFITVNWTAVANPGPDAKVTGYIIESDTGGRVFAAANVTTIRFRNVVGAQAYKFRVAASNKNGNGAFGPFSAAAVAATNTDEVRATSYTADNIVNPIYNSDGTIDQGSYGAPTVPGKPTVAAGATTTANVTWTAPTTGQPSGGYDVKASTGQTVHAAPSALTINVPGLTVSNVITFTVTAIGQLQNATSTPSNNYTVV